MPIVGGDNSTYLVRPIQSRVDGDGKEWIYARSHGALTAKSPYLARLTNSGWTTIALFDTGSASTTAASHPQYVAFVPDTAIGSDTDGWGQCGGVCIGVGAVSQSQTTGNYLLWSDATLTGSTAASATTIACNVYGIVLATASSGTHDIMLRGSNSLLFGTT